MNSRTLGIDQARIRCPYFFQIPRLHRDVTLAGFQIFETQGVIVPKIEYNPYRSSL